jgi:hypothetical protein
VQVPRPVTQEQQQVEQLQVAAEQLLKSLGVQGPELAAAQGLGLEDLQAVQDQAEAGDPGQAKATALQRGAGPALAHLRQQAMRARQRRQTLGMQTTGAQLSQARTLKRSLSLNGTPT